MTKTSEALRDDLTPVQKQALDGVMFLQGGARRTGRTYLLATAALIYAIESRSWVQVWDHGVYSSVGLMVLRDRIRLTAIKHDVEIEWSETQRAFRVKGVADDTETIPHGDATPVGSWHSS
jgi:hypothetical protein